MSTLTRCLIAAFAFVPLLFWLAPSSVGKPAAPAARVPTTPAASTDEYQALVASFGNVSTVAGVHEATTTNPDGTDIDFWTSASEGAAAKTTALSNPHVAAADALGNIYIADKASHAILRITPDGTIHTFAGTHTAGFNGDGPAPATSLQLNAPNGLYVFPDGTVFLLDPGNHRIRRVGTDGTMTTLVNDPDPNWYPSGRALWVQPDQQLIYYTNEYAPAAVGGVNQGACVKRWTPTNGIELVCDKSMGFYNPGNLDVNPVDGKLYVCDRAESDTTNTATGVWRIDGTNQRTRMTGNVTQAAPADGQPALSSYIAQTRGIAFLQNGAYFLCGHKDGSIWYVDTAGLLHRYIQGSGSKDGYSLPDGVHPPLTGKNYLAQPREITLGPNGNLVGVSNDSGYVFVVKSALTPTLPTDLRLTSSNGTQGTQLAWTSQAGQSYVVERTPGLQPSAWQIIGATKATTTIGAFTDSTAAGLSAAFYRLSPPR